MRMCLVVFSTRWYLCCKCTRSTSVSNAGLCFLAQLYFGLKPTVLEKLFGFFFFFSFSFFFSLSILFFLTGDGSNLI